MDLDTIVVNISAAAVNAEKVLNEFRQLFKSVQKIADDASNNIAQAYERATGGCNKLVCSLDKP